MSVEKRAIQAKRWFVTAQDDLQTVRILHENGKFPQSCFYAQQAGEKALKAIYFLHDAEPWGHSLVKLSKEFHSANDVSDGLLRLSREFRELDRYYIPTRYPDGLPGTTPAEAYGSDDSESALDAATRVVGFAQDLLLKEPPHARPVA